MSTLKATFACGCFWGVEVVFRSITGVVDAQVGYTGGHTPHPTYKQVCTGTTGHAEAVQVEYDPKKVSYEKLLDVFWANHDPTTLNRQGPDTGEQYRSEIFTHSAAQEKAAKASLKKLADSRKFKAPIVTRITPATTFWPAEDYHQRYLEKKGLATCHVKQ